MLAEAETRQFLSLQDFASWYDSKGNPILNIGCSLAYKTDDAIAVPIFRWKNFQVELYLIEDMRKVVEHAHPYVHVIQKVYFSSTQSWSDFTPKLVYPNTHGNFITDGSEYMVLTYEMWHPELNITTLAATWKGKTVGPVQEQLIKSIYPLALVENGYADITVGLNI